MVPSEWNISGDRREEIHVTGIFWAVLSNRSITHYSQHAIELLVHHEPPQLKAFFHFCEDNSKLMSIWLPFNCVHAHTYMWSIHRHPSSPLPLLQPWLSWLNVSPPDLFCFCCHVTLCGMTLPLVSLLSPKISFSSSLRSSPPFNDMHRDIPIFKHIYNLNLDSEYDRQYGICIPFKIFLLSPLSILNN